MGGPNANRQEKPTKSIRKAKVKRAKMNSIFSIDDFSDPFWEAPPPLNSDSSNPLTADQVSHSQPEWTFEMFLQEISSSAVSSEPLGNNNNAIVGVSSAQSLPSVSGQNDFEDDSRFRRDHENWDSAAPVIADSDNYHRLLKNKLETECATVVALRVYLLFPLFFMCVISIAVRRSKSQALILSPFVLCIGCVCEA